MLQPAPQGDMYKSHAELAREVDIKHKPTNYHNTMISLINKEWIGWKEDQILLAEKAEQEKERERLKKLQKELGSTNIREENQQPSMADMEDIPIADYDGLSETPARAHQSSRYQSKIEGSELLPTKLSVKPNLGLQSPYQGKTA